MFQKRLVAEVPWDIAYKKYATRLKTAGHNLPSTTNNPKEALKKAFISGPVTSHRETSFPIHKVEEISSQEAIQKLASLKKEAELISKISIEHRNRKIALQQKLEKWVDGRYITLSQMQTLLSSQADPSSIMKVASHIADANMVQSGKYTNPEGMRPVSVLSHAEAWGMLREAEVNTKSENKALKDRVVQQAKSYITKFAKNGLITKKQADELLGMSSLKESVTKLASLVSTQLSSKSKVVGSSVKVSNYSGIGVQKSQPQVTAEQAKKLILSKAAADKERNDRVGLYIHSKQANAALNYVNKLRDAGVISDADIKTLDLNSSSSILLDKVANIVNTNNLNKKNIGYKTSKTANYSGEGIDSLFGSSYEEPDLESAISQLQGTKSTAFVSPIEIKGVLKWASEQMHEGTMGRELDSLLQARFSPQLLKAASDLITLEREKHEGLAGVLYVDAAHYASPSGVTGCEKGAMRHRASAVKNVLAMSRCASCVFKNANNTCQKYNKALVSKPPVENSKDYQAEMIRLANASDQENTQALFSQNNVIEEFQLQKDAADLELEQSPEYQSLEGVVFGDFDFE
jgi:hypothetical protein